MKMQGAGDKRAQVDAGPDRDRESSVLDLLRAEYNDPAQVAYLTDRFGFRMQLTRRNTRRARAYFFAARIVVIGSGALLPAVVTLQSQSHGTAHTWLSAFAIALSVLIAIIGGLLQTSRMDQRWRLHLWVLFELRNEGWALAERHGVYADKASAERFTTFVDRTEALLNKFESSILGITGNPSDGSEMSLDSPPNKSAVN